MPNQASWAPNDKSQIALDTADVRLRPIADYLLLHSTRNNPGILMEEVVPGADGSSFVGKARAWSSAEVAVEFAWFPATQLVRRIALSKPIQVSKEIALPFMEIRGLRQHSVAEVGGPESDSPVTYSGGMTGILKVGERLLACAWSGAGLPSFDLSIDFAATDNAGVQPPGLRDLAAFLGLVNDPHADLQWLPKELQSADLITLTGLSARIEPKDPGKLTKVSVSLELGGKPWPMIPGVSWLEAGDLKAILDVEHPLDSDYRFPRLTVTGAVKLDGVSEAGGDARIDLEVRWPDLAVQGELEQNQRIKLGKLLEHLHLPGGGLPEDFAITQLGFLAEPDMAKKEFSFHATVEKPWALDLPGGTTLSIESLSFSLPYREGDLPTLKPSFYGVIGIGGADIFLSAEREAEGWRFSGRSGPGQPITVGKWVESLAQHFGAVGVPGPVAKADVENVAVRFNTGTKDFHFSIEAKLPVKELATDPLGGARTAEDLDLTLSLDLLHRGDGFEQKFAGEIQLGGRTFDLNFSKADAASGAGGTTMVAAYHDRDGDKVTLKEFLSAVGADVSEVPDSFSVTLHSALFAFEKSANPAIPSWKVFGINIDGGLNLSNLPLIGKVLPANETLSLEFQAIHSSREIVKNADGEKLIAQVNALLPTGATPLPTVDKGGTLIANDIGLATTLHLGSEVIHLNLPVKIDKASNVAVTSSGAAGGSQIVRPGTVAAPVTLTQDGLKWFPLHKSFGPAHFERIGAGLADGNVRFAMDASLNIGGLSLSLDGLGVSSPLDRFVPSFQLRGIGIDYAGGPVAIGGSFLRLGEEEFAGTALIQTDALSLSAIGAYGDVDGTTSLFVYAVLDYPLGGPSFFFVTGLAAGFGYNRSLLMPAIEELPAFPLVAEATAGAGLPKDVMGELKKLGQYLPPYAGQCFLAVGVKFTSFKQIDSFALLAVSFGKRFEIDVLGQSTLVVPAQIPGAAKVDPLARVTIALLARYIHDEGLLAVDARITPGSFILSEKCHLTGGFSFYSWFAWEHSGDFVVTLGGYHPAFTVPAHYPQLPRLAFTWQVVPELVVKGDAYYALTSHALMAGGHLEASYQSDELRAHFLVGADFLISWQPYHYDAQAYINVGGSYDSFLGTIAVDLGAQLHLWGPEFAGTAELDLYVTTVHATFGDQTRKVEPYIDWDTFKTAFLPDRQGVVSLAVESGVVEAGNPKREDDPTGASKFKSSDLGTLNPSELRIATHSLIPCSEILVGGRKEFGGVVVGVAPIGAHRCTSRHAVTIEMEHETTGWGDATGDFRFERVIKKTPAALWGPPSTEGKPAVNPEQKFVDGVSGLRLSPLKVPAAHAARAVPAGSLEWDRETSPVDLSETFSAFWDEEPNGSGAVPGEAIESTINRPEVVAARNRHLTALGLDSGKVRVGGLSGRMLLATPRRGFFAEPTA